MRGRWKEVFLMSERSRQQSNRISLLVLFFIVIKQIIHFSQMELFVPFKQSESLYISGLLFVVVALATILCYLVPILFVIEITIRFEFKSSIPLPQMNVVYQLHEYQISKKDIFQTFQVIRC
jgi:hypothetical protein